MNGYRGAMLSKMKRLLPILLLACLTVGGVRTIYPNTNQNIALKRLQLDPVHRGPRRVGELIFLGAWELHSRNGDFGGISALTALADGRFIGVSDAGMLVGFGLTSADHADRPFISPLPDSHGPDATFRDRDSEGMSHDPDSGQFWVSYEANHAIRRFPRSFARTNGIARPREMQDWPDNKGAESLIRLSDGRFIAIAESFAKDDTHPALLFSGDPVAPGTHITPFHYRPPKGYRVTDGVQLPDGRLLILNRRIGLPNGFSAKMAVVDLSAIGTGDPVTATVIATLAAPLLIDNMEGIAVSLDGKNTIIWLISDNNFNIFQCTLLMKFRLSERLPKKKPEAVAAPGFDSL